jgi:hypothetical protein
MIIATSSSSPDFSAAGLVSIDGVQVTKLPPGVALGAGDLHEWAQRRNAGRASVYVSKEERERRDKRREDRADRWLRAAARRKRLGRKRRTERAK